MCSFAQFSKPNLNPVCCFLTCLLVGNSEKETLTVNIFWLGIHHKKRSNRVKLCGTKSQCASFQSPIRGLGQFLRPVNKPPNMKFIVYKIMLKSVLNVCSEAQTCFELVWGGQWVNLACQLSKNEIIFSQTHFGVWLISSGMGDYEY